MKKLTYTTAIFMAMVATSVFAHHPSVDTNPNFETVDAILTDTPHDEMLEADMGATTAAGDSAAAAVTREQDGWTAGEDRNQAGTMTVEQPQPQTGDGPGMDAAAAAGTIDLMENVD